MLRYFEDSLDRIVEPVRPTLSLALDREHTQAGHRILEGESERSCVFPVDHLRVRAREENNRMSKELYEMRNFIQSKTDLLKENCNAQGELISFPSFCVA